MRALARRCGVPTVTLYRHVRDQEDLLARWRRCSRSRGGSYSSSSCCCCRRRRAAWPRRQALPERLPADDFENLSRLSGLFLLRSSDRHFRGGLELIIRSLESAAG
jgi:AcrR family transcriptional regulator